MNNAEFTPNSKSEISPQINPEFLHAATPDEFLPPISGWTTIGGLVLIGAFGAAIALSAVLKYNVTVKAPAIVRPAGELRIVQSAVEGTVKSIHVEANSAVKQGDIIAYIDDSRLQTKKSQLQGNMQQNQLQLVQIDAQIRQIESQIVSEKERSERAIASAKAELSRTQRDLQERLIASQSQVSEAEANLSQTREELQKTIAELKSAEANLKSTEAALNAAIARRDRYQPLVEAGGLSQDQFAEAKLAVEQQQQAVESQKAVVEAQKQAIERQKRVVEAAEARLQGTLATLNPSNASVAIAGEKIAQEKAAGESSLARLNQEREQLIQRKLEIENQRDRDKQELQQSETELANTAIRASVNGTIQQLNLRNTAQVVRPGEIIAEIYPSEAPLVVKASVPSQEIGQIKTGQTVHFRVSACPYPDYGTLKGKVSAVSPDVVMPPNKGNEGALESAANVAGASYNVTIQPDNLKLSAGNRECAIQPGMEGSADIISKEETVLQFILRKARLMTDV